MFKTIKKMEGQTEELTKQNNKLKVYLSASVNQIGNLHQNVNDVTDKYKESEEKCKELTE